MPSPRPPRPQVLRLPEEARRRAAAPHQTQPHLDRVLRPDDGARRRLDRFLSVWKRHFTARSTPSTRRLLDGVAMPVPHRSMAPDTLVDFHTGYCDASGKQTVHELTPNMTGFHVLELDVHATKGITLCNSFVDRKRFDIYGKTDLEVDRFSAFVKKLPAGRVVAIAITDTAVAAKRPPSDKLYDALRLLGAPSQMEKIGYRFPFAFLGVKGGTGHLLMDKTKFLLRIDAALAAKRRDLGRDDGEDGRHGEGHPRLRGEEVTVVLSIGPFFTLRGMRASTKPATNPRFS